MTRNEIKKVGIIGLVVCLMMVFGGCGTSSLQTASQETAQEEISVDLSEEEFVYHGVHMKVPDVFSMKQNENGLDEFESEWKGNPPEGHSPGWIYCYLSDDEADPYDTGSGGAYDPYNARIYYAEGDYEGRISEDTAVERKRVNGIDVLIKRYSTPLEEGRDPVVNDTIEVLVLLQSCVVDIRFVSTTEQFNDLFEECVNSIWVEDDEIPELTRQTQPEALEEAGLTTQAWEYHNLYMHMPDTYTLVKKDDDGLIWISDDANATISFSVDTSALLKLNQDDWEKMLSQIEGFQELTDFDTGVTHGMFFSFVSYRLIQDDQLFHVDEIIVLPSRFSEETVVQNYVYLDDDTETSDLGTRMCEVMHYADGWEGDGLLEVEPISLDEFKENLGL